MSDKLIIFDDHREIAIDIDMAELSSKIELMNLAYFEDGIYLFRTLDAHITLDVVQEKPWESEFDYIYRRLRVEDYLCIEPSFNELSKIKIPTENFDKLLSLMNYFGYHPDLLWIILDNIPLGFNWGEYDFMARKMRNICLKNYTVIMSNTKITILDTETNTIINETKIETITNSHKSLANRIISKPFIKLICNSWIILIMISGYEFCIYDLLYQKIVKLGDKEYDHNTRLTVSNHRKYIASSTCQDTSIIETKKLSTIRSLNIHHRIAIAFQNNDNKYAILENWSKIILIGKIDMNKVIRKIEIPSVGFDCEMFFSKNDKYLVVYSKTCGDIFVINICIDSSKKKCAPLSESKTIERSFCSLIYEGTGQIICHGNVYKTRHNIGIYGQLSPGNRFLVFYTGIFIVIDIETGEVKGWRGDISPFFSFIDDFHLIIYCLNGQTGVMNIVDGHYRTKNSHGISETIEAADVCRMPDIRLRDK